MVPSSDHNAVSTLPRHVKYFERNRREHDKTKQVDSNRKRFGWSVRVQLEHDVHNRLLGDSRSMAFGPVINEREIHLYDAICKTSAEIVQLGGRKIPP